MGGRRRHFVALFDSIYHRGACIKQKPRPRHTARGCESILASLCAVQRKKKTLPHGYRDETNGKYIQITERIEVMR